MHAARQIYSVLILFKKKCQQTKLEIGVQLTRNSFQTFDKYFHVAFASGFIQIEIGASTFHLVSTIGERLINTVLW